MFDLHSEKMLLATNLYDYEYEDYLFTYIHGFIRYLAKT